MAAAAEEVAGALGECVAEWVAGRPALVAGVMTILMGLLANYPFALATGLGLNSLVAVTIAPQVTWPEAMAVTYLV